MKNIYKRKSLKLIEEITEQYKWRDSLCPQIGRFSIVKIFVLSNLSYSSMQSKSKSQQVTMWILHKVILKVR